MLKNVTLFTLFQAAQLSFFGCIMVTRILQLLKNHTALPCLMAFLTSCKIR